MGGGWDVRRAGMLAAAAARVLASPHARGTCGRAITAAFTTRAGARHDARSVLKLVGAIGHNDVAGGEAAGYGRESGLGRSDGDVAQFHDVFGLCRIRFTALWIDRFDDEPKADRSNGREDIPID